VQNCISAFLPALEERRIELTMPDVVQQPSEDELIEIIGGFEGTIAGDDPLTARVLDHAKRMRIISKWGRGDRRDRHRGGASAGSPSRTHPACSAGRSPMSPSAMW
jgi:phosphoglycerate dehydrogenase-like enzyme